MNDESPIQKIVNDFLRIDVVIHKRRCAVRAKVRESYELESECCHVEWDIGRRWCNYCGVTLEELFYRGEK